jgi:hypothetical protein
MKFVLRALKFIHFKLFSKKFRLVAADEKYFYVMPHTQNESQIDSSRMKILLMKMRTNEKKKIIAEKF